jgi:hypothetical protein
MSYYIFTSYFLVRCFDLKDGKARQDKVRQGGKVPTLLGQEMADSGKPGRPFTFSGQCLAKYRNSIPKNKGATLFSCDWL